MASIYGELVIILKSWKMFNFINPGYLTIIVSVAAILPAGA